MTTPIPHTAPVPNGWAVARGDDGRATLTHDGEIVATAAYGTQPNRQVFMPSSGARKYR